MEGSRGLVGGRIEAKHSSSVGWSQAVGDEIAYVPRRDGEGGKASGGVLEGRKPQYHVFRADGCGGDEKVVGIVGLRPESEGQGWTSGRELKDCAVPDDGQLNPIQVVDVVQGGKVGIVGLEIEGDGYELLQTGDSVFDYKVAGDLSDGGVLVKVGPGQAPLQSSSAIGAVVGDIVDGKGLYVGLVGVGPAYFPSAGVGGRLQV